MWLFAYTAEKHRDPNLWGRAVLLPRHQGAPAQPCVQAVCGTAALQVLPRPAHAPTRFKVNQGFCTRFTAKLGSMLPWLTHYLSQLQYCWMLLLQALSCWPFLLQHQCLLDLKHPNPKLALRVLLVATGHRFLVAGPVPNPTPLKNSKAEPH